MKTIQLSCSMWMFWENLEKERLMGLRVFTRGIWYALLIYSCFGLVTYGKEVLFPPIRFGFLFCYVAMLLRCLVFADYPDSTSPELKDLRLLSSFIILCIMFFVPFNYPTSDVFGTTFSFIAGVISIYQLSMTFDIGQALLLVVFAFLSGGIATEFASLDYPLASGFVPIFLFQYVMYVYNIEFLVDASD
ncbi:hypothetical protein AALP_AA1G098600 [Arabis alpina]|uniref:Uncharacterized protein n=1 Tax=Arabis alpina TaxID=50452 RepID=A0A087HM93_ARAAL|nr:hypothetical protein AALP_AA1G098600 [Arabis alpina]